MTVSRFESKDKVLSEQAIDEVNRRVAMIDRVRRQSRTKEFAFEGQTVRGLMDAALKAYDPKYEQLLRDMSDDYVAGLFDAVFPPLERTDSHIPNYVPPWQQPLSTTTQPAPTTRTDAGDVASLPPWAQPLSVHNKP
jgi:hypothetical protein